MQKQNLEEDWALLKPHIFAAIMDHLRSGASAVLSEEENAEAEAQPTDTSWKWGEKNSEK